MTKVRKLGRPSLVCSNCKRRKIKCDRNQPCTQCVKSDISFSCSYDHCDPINIKKHIVPHEDSSVKLGDYTRFDSALFNYPTLEFKKPLFVNEDGNIKYEPPLSLEAIVNNNKQFVKFRSLMPFLFNVKENESYKEEEKIGSTKELKDLTGVYTKEEIDEIISTYISPNIEAIVERINHFDNDMITGTNFVFVPVKAKLSFLDKGVISDPVSLNQFICKEFKNESDYAFFGNIFIILKIVASTTEFDENINFKHKLDLTTNELSSFGLKCLSFSDYMKKPTFNALLGFLLFRLNFFISDSITEYSNAGPFFQIALTICYKLGIHIRCDHIEGYAEDVVRGIWNLIQFIDCITSVHSGTPAKIDYKYSVPRLFNYWEPIILYFRKIVLSFNSVSPITLNDIIDLAQNATKLFSVFKSFDELLNNSPLGPVQYVFSIIIKADFLICYEILLLNLRLSIDDVHKLPIKIEEKDLILIEDLKAKCESQLFYGMILSTKLIKDISTCKISHKFQNVKLLMSLRLIFSKFIIISNNLIFSYLSVFNRSKNLDISTVSMKYSDISLSYAEKYICKQLDDITFDDEEYITMNSLMSSIPKLNEYLIDFYVTVSGSCPIILSGKFNIHFKFLLFVCMLLQTTYEYTDKQSLVDPNFQFKLDDWKIVIDKTTSYFINDEEETTKNLDWEIPVDDVRTGFETNNQFDSFSDLFFDLNDNVDINEPGNDNINEPDNGTINDELNPSEALITGASKYFNTSDWRFLTSNELRDRLGYAEDNSKENTEFDEIFQMFVE